MLPADRLRDKLTVMNGKGAQFYRELTGAYRFERHVLHLDTIHADPIAPFAHARIQIDQAEAQVPRGLWAESGGLALKDFLARALRDAASRSIRTRWAGRGAPVVIDVGSQEMLARDCCHVEEDLVEVRFTIGFPADGRKVQAAAAQALLFDEIPAMVDAALVWGQLDGQAGARHVDAYQDYLAVREALAAHGLVAFLADGAMLARDPGPGDRPLRAARAVALRAPDDLAVTIALPSRRGDGAPEEPRSVRGLGIRRGVTVIAGAASTGKTTLLNALAAGVYAHVPGDGRELVVTLPDAVAIRAEAGRRVERVDVGGFLPALDHGILSVERAASSASMAAAVAEALEIGTRLLLFDEDESAVAFLARDERMRRLLPGAVERRVPLVDRVRPLWDAHGVSSIIATGSIGAFLDVADTVIVLNDYQPHAAREWHAAREGHPARAASQSSAPVAPGFALPAPRYPILRGIGGMKGRGLHADLRGRDTLTLGRDTIDLRGIPQLVDAGQARAAGDAIAYAADHDFVTGEASVSEVLDRIFADIDAHGLSVLAQPGRGRHDYAMPRRQDVGAVLNRLRSFQVGGRRSDGTAADINSDAGGDAAALAEAPASAPAETPGELAAKTPTGADVATGSRRDASATAIED